MAVFERAKRATDPLDERVRARLCGELSSYASSGSEHNIATAGDPSHFPRLLHDFLDNSDDESFRCVDSDSESTAGSEEDADCTVSVIAMLRELLDPIPAADPLRFRLILEAETAAEMAVKVTGSAFRRVVMVKLRERGYNAGICKARWEGGGGLTAGSYEYIDVLFEGTMEVGERRYILDFGFAEHFKIARATEGYRSMTAALPSTFVARPEKLSAAVRILAEATRKSLKNRGMSVPPWRKKRYMMAKWLGPYRRTVNTLPAAMERRGGWDASCRMVGFGRLVE